MSLIVELALLLGVLALTLAAGLAGVAVGYSIGRQQGALRGGAVSRRIGAAGFAAAEDGWELDVEGVVVSLQSNAAGWGLSAPLPNIPLRITEGKAQEPVGDGDFDRRFQVRALGRFDRWLWVPAQAREALVRLSMRGTVRVHEDRISLVARGEPASDTEIREVTDDLSRVVAWLRERSWGDVCVEESDEVLAVALRSILVDDAALAPDVAKRLQHRTSSVALQTEVAIALQDGPALRELLDKQPGLAASVRVASSMSNFDLLPALAAAAELRGATSLAACSIAARERPRSDLLQEACLAALRTWLAQAGKRSSEEADRAVLNLLWVGRRALSESDDDLLRGGLAVRDAQALAGVLAVVAEYGTVGLVPDLRALLDRPLPHSALPQRVRQAISSVQGRSSGRQGGLALAVGGGELALAEEPVRGQLSVAQPDRST